MKPVSLTMKAFGPFRKEVSIDFRAFEDVGLYLISGDTGSGKTTIFDAICFALFSDTSGGTRKGEMMRSDFAGAEEETFVELTFEEGGEIYTIRRSPRYERAKRRGEGTTTEAASVLLTLPDGTTINRIDEATRKVEEILGMNVENFRQMVMIAQNEFKKMLEAGSSEQAEIFRGIFNTKLYRSLQERLREGAKIERDRTQEAAGRVSIELGQLQDADFPDELLKEREGLLLLLKEEAPIPEGAGAVDAFFQGFTEQLKKQHTHIQEANALREKSLALEKELLIQVEQARHIEATKEELQMKRDEREKLHAFEEEMNALSSRIDRSRRVEERIKPVDETVKRLSEELESWEQTYALHLKEQGIITARLNKLLGLKEQIEEEKRTLSRKQSECGKLEAEQKRIEAILSLKSEVNGIEENLMKEKKRLMDEEEASDKSKKELQSLAETYIEPEKIRLKLSALDEKKGRLSRLMEDLAALQEQERKTVEKEAQLNQMRCDYKKALTSQKKAEQESLSAKATFYGQQAALLAKELKEDSPCPVCGSIHHPNKAPYPDHFISQEEVKRLEALFTQAGQETARLKESGKRMSQEVEERRAELQKKSREILGDVKDTDLRDVCQKKREEAKQKWQKLVEEMTSLTEELDRNERSSSKIERLRSQIETLEKKVVAREKSITSLMSRKEAILDAIRTEEEGLSEKDALRSLQKRNALRQEIEDTEERISRYEEDLSQTHEDKHKNDEAIRLDRVQIEDRQQKLEEAKSLFRTRLSEEGLKDKEGFLAARMTEEERSEAEKKFTSYVQECRSLDLLIQKLEVDLLKAPSYNLSELTNLLDQAQKDRRQAEDMLDGSKLIYEHNRKLKEIIEEDLKEYARKQRLYSDWQKLSQIANRPGNTFEQFVQRFYFDQILLLANLRLRNMSGGRYELVQDRTKSFSLLVSDKETGKERSVKTLSGGESFKASLALALGVSDVVQNLNGGMHIDCIFIDEGFGSLDPLSLEQAVQVLASLSEDRTIGIISHVEALKSQVANQIEVKKEKQGSSLRVYSVS